MSVFGNALRFVYFFFLNNTYLYLEKLAYIGLICIFNVFYTVNGCDTVEPNWQPIRKRRKRARARTHGSEE